jgi:hypothetical protein
MKEFINKAISNNALEARKILDETIKNLVKEKIDQIKLRLTAEMYEEVDLEVDFADEELDEAIRNVTKQGRTKIVRVRVRKGKIQRRKKLSAVKGYTIRGGRLVRMSAMERRHRKMAARRAKYKRRAKLSQTLRKRRMSLRKRRSLGL